MLQPLSSQWTPTRLTLECVDIETETHDVKSFHLRVLPNAAGEAPLCLHRPGQFLTLRLRHGDMLVPRSYTIASPPSRPMLLTLTVKRDPHGLVSRYLHDVLRIGERLAAQGPGGSFDLFSVAPRRHIVMLSGGSGITPMMAMLRYLQDRRETGYRVSFLHSARSPADLLFRDELTAIAARGGAKLGFICERDALPGMEAGFLTRDMLQAHVPDLHDCTVLTCGPAPYMRAVRAMLGEAGFDMAHYHEESFGDPAERRNPDGATPESLRPDGGEPAASAVPPPVDHQPANAGQNLVHFTLSGKAAPYRPGETILDVASREGIAVPTNCQMGLCGTCKAHCSAGQVAMDDTEGLAPGELEQGMVLTCCGRPQGAVSIAL